MEGLESDTDEKEGQVSLAHSQNNTDITLVEKLIRIMQLRRLNLA